MDVAELDSSYWAPRRCLREPLPELFKAAFLLEEAVNAHLNGFYDTVKQRLNDTNTKSIREFSGSLWHSAKKYPEQVHYLRRRQVHDLPPRKDRAKDRHPSADMKRSILQRDGYVCRYCGVPTIPVEVRRKLHSLYPDELPWPRVDAIQHAAFQALWLQFDHVIPHSYGGCNDIENIVVSCGICNFGKGGFHIEELGLIDPRTVHPRSSCWNGLTQLLDGIR